MNIKIISGRVISSGDEGLQERKNTDNLDEIIRLENKRDILKNQLQSAAQELAKYNYRPRKKKKLRLVESLISVLISTLTAALTGFFVSFCLSGFDLYATEVWTLFEGMNTHLCVAIFWGVTMPFACAFVNLVQYCGEKDRMQTVLGLEATIEYLNKELEKTLDELEKAQNKTAVISEPVESDVVSFDAFNDDYSKAIREKAKRLLYLGTIRDELIKYSDDETLMARLRDTGMQPDEVEVAKGFILREKTNFSEY